MGGAQIRDILEDSFDPLSSENASLVLAYDGSNNLIRIDKTVGIKLYRKTLTWDLGNLTAISAWVEVP